MLVPPRDIVDIEVCCPHVVVDGRLTGKPVVFVGFPSFPTRHQAPRLQGLWSERPKVSLGETRHVHRTRTPRDRVSSPSLSKKRELLVVLLVAPNVEGIRPRTSHATTECTRRDLKPSMSRGFGTKADAHNPPPSSGPDGSSLIKELRRRKIHPELRGRGDSTVSA